jgi:hypothetical protein
MPIQSIERLYDESDPLVEIGIRLNGVGAEGYIQALYADIPGQSWTPARLENARQWVQNEMDTRIDRATLDPEHLYIKNGDPGLDWLFWDGTDVVERLIYITGPSDPDTGTTGSAIIFDGAHLYFSIGRYSRRGWGE